MTDEDTRSLPAAAQAALRNRAVRAVLDGMTQAQAARVFGVHRNAVNRWIKRYREGGWAGLAEQRRGRRPGEQAALSEPQQQEVIALVRDVTPDQLGLAGFLWTRDAVAELIARRYGLLLARTPLGPDLPGWEVGTAPSRSRPAPRPAGSGGLPVGPRCGRRADRRPLWPPAGPHHRGRLSTRLGLQPPAAPAPRPGAEPGRGAPLADHRLSRHPRPGPPRGRRGAVAGRDGRALRRGGGPPPRAAR